jgi:ABC-type thiamine transport system ATPase subunit
VTLRATIGKGVRDGVARLPEEHSGGLRGRVDVAPANVEAQ